MYIWIGLSIDNDFQNIKEEVERVENKYKFDNSNLTLPFHISLKISFEVENDIYDSIIEDILSFYRTLKSFKVKTKAIEKHDNIVWVRMIENDELKRIHTFFDDMLLNKYNIPLHPFDKEFIYHSTLVMNDNIRKVSKAYRNLEKIDIPSEVNVSKCLIGTSEDGNPWTFRIVKSLDLN